MRHKVIARFFIAIFLLSAMATNDAFSQVTIGSQIIPNKGALLDLKEHSSQGDNITASRGIAMPRVKLTHKNDLFPMFEDTPGSGLANDSYDTPARKTEEDRKHIGLIVFHIDKCTFGGTGLYVWTGNEWKKLGAESTAGLDLSRNYFNLPGGMDLRPITNQSLTVKWSDESINPTLTQAPSGGLTAVPFISSPLPSILTSSPATFNIMPDPMTPADIAGNLWMSKETELSLIDPDCGDTKKVILNQTNYALAVDNSMSQNQNNRSDIRHLITRIDAVTHQPAWIADYFWLNVKSNAAWKSSYRAISPNIIDDIIIPSQGGQELNNGTTDGGPDGRWYFPARNTSGANTQYKTAGVLTFYDSIPVPNHRFDSITVTFIQCASQPDLSPIQDGDILAESSWADNVLSHGDQEGNRFYSASFGSAGRWMITNLAAKKYATNEGGTNLSVYTGDSIVTKNTAARAYGYPRYIHVDNPQPSDTIRLVSDWDVPPVRHVEHGAPWYEEQGLLYTWYAATNQNDIYTSDQGQAAPGLENPPGTDEVENTGKYGTAPNKYIQGICPDGWHLPSDREWNELERELYNNPKTYSEFTDEQIGKFLPLSWDPNFETLNGFRGRNFGYREEGYSGVFKEICPVRDYEANWTVYSHGYSKEPAKGGFNVMSVGFATGPHMNTYGGTARFWTSSSLAGSAWGRHFSYDYGGVSRFPNQRFYLFSVRCKKN